MSIWSRHRAGLNDLAVDLAAQAAGVLSALAGLVRAMNCYYSNLIEGHDTHPIDIERALNNDYSRSCNLTSGNLAERVGPRHPGSFLRQGEPDADPVR